MRTKNMSRSLIVCFVIFFAISTAFFWAGTAGLTKTANAAGYAPTVGADLYNVNFDLGRSFPQAPLTYEAWIKLSSSPKDSSGTYGVIIGNNNSYNTYRAINFEIASNANPSIVWGGTVYRFNNVNAKTGSFAHVAITIDRSDNTMKCYLNGQLKQTITAPPATLQLDPRPFYLGRDGRPPAGATCFSGEIHSITVFATTRTASQIEQDMNNIPQMGSDSNLLYSLKIDTRSPEFTKYTGYNYISDDGLKNGAPLTFMGWVKLPQDMPDYVRGGSIFSNHLKVRDEENGLYSFEVSTHGNLYVRWNHLGFIRNFNSVDLRTGKWEHIAFVYNPQDYTFKFYHNGALKEAVNDVNAGTYTTRQAFAIGSDWRTSNEVRDKVPLPFMGEIRQITAYKVPLTQSQISEDMNKTSINKDNLLFNWYIEKYGDPKVKKIEDTSSNNSDLRLASFGLNYFQPGTPAKYDYSFVVVPDTQNLVDWQPKRSEQLFQSLASLAGPNKVNFLMHLGDLTNRKANKEIQFQRARDHMKYIDGIIPYSIVPGNHDYDDHLANGRKLTLFNKYFNYSQYKDNPTFGGAYEVGKMENTYHIFNAEGVDYLVFALEFAPRDEVLIWANQITSENPDKRVIVTTHGYFMPLRHRMHDGSQGAPDQYGFYGSTSANNGEEMWEKFIKHHSNIFMVISGHINNPDVVWDISYGEKGNKVFEVVVDLQGFFDLAGHNEPMSLFMYFNETKKTMEWYLINPVTRMLLNQTNHIMFDISDPKNPTIGEGPQEEEEPPIGCKTMVTGIELAFIPMGLIMAKRFKDKKK